MRPVASYAPAPTGASAFSATSWEAFRAESDATAKRKTTGLRAYEHLNPLASPGGRVRRDRRKSFRGLGEASQSSCCARRTNDHRNDLLFLPRPVHRVV